MSFFGTQQTPLLVFSNILVLCYLYITLKPALNYPFELSNKRIFTTKAVLLLFCLFSFWGTDWYGYLSYFESVKQGWGEHVPVENIYIWLMEELPSYLMFRIVVWGGALLFLFKMINNLRLNKGQFLFFFCCISLIWFSYARVSLAMAIMFCGVSFLLKNRENHGNNTINFLFGIFLIVGSFYFHKSSVIGIVAIGFALLLRRLGSKRGIRLMILSFPIFLFAFQSIFSSLFEELIADDTSILNEYAVAGAGHLDAQKGVQGIGIIIQRFLEWTPSYLTVYICYKALSDKIEMPQGIILMMYSLCSIVFVSSLFAFDLGLNTSILYIRMMRFAQIPFCICITYLYENGLYLKQVRTAYSLGILSCVYATTYMLYNIIVG